MSEFPEDKDGGETLKTLEACQKVASRIAGTGPSSLGLHPAVYFYTEKGRHLPDLLLGILLLVRRKLQDNNPVFFKNFTKSREAIEKYVIENKALITQALQIVRSKSRMERVAELFDFIVSAFSAGKIPTEEELVSVIAPNSVSKILSIKHSPETDRFSDDTKSAIFIRQALSNAMKCPICKGYLDPAKSGSYDHIQRVQDGGKGAHDNGQITHPYCNTAVKN